MSFEKATQIWLNGLLKELVQKKNRLLRKLEIYNNYHFQVDYGHEEVKVKFGDDPRRFNTQSKEFLKDKNGCVSGIRTVLVQWTKVAGRWQMTEVPDSEKIYPCQLVLLGTVNFRFKHVRFKEVFRFKEEFHRFKNFST